MTMSLSAIIFLAVAATPARGASVRDHSEAYYYFSLGQQARLAGSADEALEEYRKAQKLDPGSGEVRAEIARTLREAGKSDEALAEAREAVRLDPESVDAHLITAQLYQLRGEGDGAEEALRNAAREYEEVVRLQP